MTEADWEGLREVRAKLHLAGMMQQRYQHEHRLIDLAIKRLAGQPREILKEAHRLAAAAYRAMRKENQKPNPDPHDRTPEVDELEEFARDAVAGRLDRPERELIRGPDGLASHVKTKDGISPIIRGPDGRPTGLGRAIPIAGASHARRG